MARTTIGESGVTRRPSPGDEVGAVHLAIQPIVTLGAASSHCVCRPRVWRHILVTHTSSDQLPASHRSSMRLPAFVALLAVAHGACAQAPSARGIPAYAPSVAARIDSADLAQIRRHAHHSANGEGEHSRRRVSAGEGRKGPLPARLWLRERRAPAARRSGKNDLADRIDQQGVHRHRCRAARGSRPLSSERGRESLSHSLQGSRDVPGAGDVRAPADAHRRIRRNPARHARGNRGRPPPPRRFSDEQADSAAPSRPDDQLLDLWNHPRGISGGAGVGYGLRDLPHPKYLRLRWG